MLMFGDSSQDVDCMQVHPKVLSTETQIVRDLYISMSS